LEIIVFKSFYHILLTMVSNVVHLALRDHFFVIFHQFISMKQIQPNFDIGHFPSIKRPLKIIQSSWRFLCRSFALPSLFRRSRPIFSFFYSPFHIVGKSWCSSVLLFIRSFVLRMLLFLKVFESFERVKSAFFGLLL